MPPWRDWYHVSGHTYGSWLRGDPRGWRARHHREHVEGDYKNPPPPGTYDTLLANSKSLMKREPVTLTPMARRVACDVMAQALLFHNLDPLAIAVDHHHYHILARFGDHKPRHWMGIAKSRSTRALSESGHAKPGGVWAVRCKCLPINDRNHQVAVFRYIVRHAEKGAALWVRPGLQRDRHSPNPASKAQGLQTPGTPSPSISCYDLTVTPPSTP